MNPGGPKEVIDSDYVVAYLREKNMLIQHLANLLGGDNEKDRSKYLTYLSLLRDKKRLTFPVSFVSLLVEAGLDKDRLIDKSLSLDDAFSIAARNKTIRAKPKTHADFVNKQKLKNKENADKPLNSERSAVLPSLKDVIQAQFLSTNQQEFVLTRAMLQLMYDNL